MKLWADCPFCRNVTLYKWSWLAETCEVCFFHCLMELWCKNTEQLMDAYSHQFNISNFTPYARWVPRSVMLYVLFPATSCSWRLSTAQFMNCVMSLIDDSYVREESGSEYSHYSGKETAHYITPHTISIHTLYWKQSHTGRRQNQIFISVSDAVMKVLWMFLEGLTWMTNWIWTNNEQNQVKWNH